MLNINLNDVESAKNGNGNNTKPSAGGYVAKIIDVTNKETFQGLVVDLDIDEGEWHGYYRNLNAEFGFWALSDFKSYKQKALGYFKDFIECIEASNEGYKWDNDETKLIGKIVGIVLYYEEYIGNDGKIKQRAKISEYMPARQVFKPDSYTVPELKKIDRPQAPSVAGVVNTVAPQTNTGFVSVDDDDIPL